MKKEYETPVIEIGIIDEANITTLSLNSYGDVILCQSDYSTGI